MQVKGLVFLLILVTSSIVSSRPAATDENREGCPADYCSMFEGICKNGGTCISKGCKGECKCTKDFSGLNCEVPENLPTTAAPTPKTEVQTKKPKKVSDDKSRENDMNLIVSLFRILSRHRPKENEVNEQKDKRRDNFPSRSEPTKYDKSNDNDNSERKRTTTTTTTRKPSPTTTTGAPLKLDNNINVPQASARHIIGNRYLDQTPRLQTVESAKSKKSVQTNLNWYPRGKYLRQDTTTVPSTEVTKVTPKVFVAETTTESTITNNKITETQSIGSSNSNVIPETNIFHAPQFLKSEKSKVNAVAPGRSTSGDISSRITNIGNKLLSSTTLSNLYLTHTLLSKSRIYISNVNNTQNKGKESSVSESQIRSKTTSNVNQNGSEGSSMDIAKGEIEMAAKRLLSNSKDGKNRKAIDVNDRRKYADSRDVRTTSESNESKRKINQIKSDTPDKKVSIHTDNSHSLETTTNKTDNRNIQSHRAEIKTNV